MFPGENPGRSRFALLGAAVRVKRIFTNGWQQFVTKVNHFYNGSCERHERYRPVSPTVEDERTGGAPTYETPRTLSE